MFNSIIALMSDPATYIVLVVVGGLIGLTRFYVKRLIASGVAHQFALRLEDHKQSLRLAAEAARYEYEHKLSQANLYAQKRHAAAVEVYQAMRVAHGSCVKLRGVREELTFAEFNVADLAKYMEDKRVPQGKQDQILASLNQDRDGAITDMKDYVRMLEEQEAQGKLIEAQNNAMLNELYFDDKVIEVINAFFSIMNDWMLYIKFPPQPHERRNVPTRDAMLAALQAVQTTLRERLSGSWGIAGRPPGLPSIPPPTQRFQKPLSPE